MQGAGERPCEWWGALGPFRHLWTPPWYHVAAGGNILHQEAGLPQTACSWHCPTPVIWSPDSTLPKCLEFSLSLPPLHTPLRTTFSSWPAKCIFPSHSPSSWSLCLPITCRCIGSWTTGQLPQDGVSLTLLACLTSGVQSGQPEEGPGAGGTHTVGMYSPGKALVV